jgi:hypothetical protein
MAHCFTEEMKLKGIQGSCRLARINLRTNAWCKNRRLIGINVDFAPRSLKGNLTVLGTRSSLVAQAQMNSNALFANQSSVEKILY